MSEKFDPYYTWLGIPPEEQPADYYRLLGIRQFETNADVIANAADKQMAHLRTIQAGQRAELAQKILNQISAARVCLLSEEKKAVYDLRLKEKLAAQSQASGPQLATAAPLEAKAARPKLRTRKTAPPLAQAEPLAAHQEAVARHPPRRRRRSGLPLALAAIALVGVVVGGILIVRLRDRPTDVAQNDSTTTDEATGANTPSDVTPVETDPQPSPPTTDPAALDKTNDETSKPPVEQDDQVDESKTLPPEKVEADVPSAMVTVVDRKPVPLEAENLPAEWRGAMRYNWVEGAKKNAYLEFEVHRAGVVYLLVSYAYEGNNSGGWVEERLDRKQLVEHGWQDLGQCPWSDAPQSVLFRRVCKQGEKYRIRTNKYGPPVLLLPPGGTALASTDTPSEREPAIEQEPAAEEGETPEVAERLPVPDEEATREAKRLVQEIYADDLAAAKSSQEQADLASKMLVSALDTGDEPTARYVLLTQTADLATQAGRGALIQQAIDGLARYYDVDALRLKAKAFYDASRQALDAPTHAALVEHVLLLIDRATEDDRYKIAEPLVDVAYTSARKVKEKELYRRIAAKRQEVEHKQELFQAVEEAANTLKEHPDDAEANLAYGQYLCIVKADWERGLPMLARGSDERLKAAAELDLAGADQAEGRVKIGDAWYEIGDSDEALEAFHIRTHHWYKQAILGLAGLAKAKVDKRMEEITKIEAVKNYRPRLPRKRERPTLAPRFLPSLKGDPARPRAARPTDLTELEERMIGVFQVVTIERKTDRREEFTVEFRSDGKVMQQGTDQIATWERDDSRIKVSFTDPEGALYLRPGKAGSFSGLRTAGDGQSWTWQVTPVTVAAVWAVEGDGNPVKKTFTLYSNGKVDDPYAEYGWTLVGNKLTIGSIHGDGGFTINPDGRTLRGRWMRGGYFNGKLVENTVGRSASVGGLSAGSGAPSRDQNWIAEDKHTGFAGNDAVKNIYTLTGLRAVSLKKTAIYFQARAATGSDTNGDIFISVDGENWLEIGKWTPRNMNAAAKNENWHVVSLDGLERDFTTNRIQVKFQYTSGKQRLNISHAVWVLQ